MHNKENAVAVSQREDHLLTAVDEDSVVDERRKRPERRTLSWHAFAYGFWNPRRRNVRRDCVDGVPLVDSFQPTWRLLAAVIILLSATDAACTIRLLESGAKELNPIMDHLIRFDLRAFVLAKILLTGAGCLVLNRIGYFPVFNRFQVRQAFFLILFAYVSLVGYEFALFLFRDI